LARHRLLGAAAQRLLQRPIRVLLDKAGDLGEPPARAGAAIVEPADDFQRQRVAALAGLGIGLGPVAAAGGGNRAERHAVGGAFGPSHTGMKGETGESDKQQARYRKQSPSLHSSSRREHISYGFPSRGAS